MRWVFGSLKQSDAGHDELCGPASHLCVSPSHIVSLSTFFVTQVCNNLWFPLIFFHKLRRQAQRPAPVLGMVVDVAIGILGVLVFIYGLKGSVETLMEDFGCLGSKWKGRSFFVAEN